MSFSRDGTDWIQKGLLINEGVKFNSEMTLISKNIYGDQNRLRRD